jgi:hypothetical protein
MAASVHSGCRHARPRVRSVICSHCRMAHGTVSHCRSCESFAAMLVIVSQAEERLKAVGDGGGRGQMQCAARRTQPPPPSPQHLLHLLLALPSQLPAVRQHTVPASATPSPSLLQSYFRVSSLLSSSSSPCLLPCPSFCSLRWLWWPLCCRLRLSSTRSRSHSIRSTCHGHRASCRYTDRPQPSSLCPLA